MTDRAPLMTTAAERDLLRSVLQALTAPGGGGGAGVRFVPGVGFTVTGTGSGRGRGQRGTVIKRMVVKSIDNDYLVCRSLDKDDGEATVDIPVAKPPELRHDEDYYPNTTALATTNSQKVVVTVDGNSETWVLPTELKYVADETQILAVRCGQTGVQTDDDPAEEIYWMDLNNAGRVWIKDES